MQKPTFDPGLTQQYTGALNRAINQDGEFSVKRAGVTLRDVHPYLFLINTPLPIFIAISLAAFFAINFIFAGIYMGIGVQNLKGAEAPTLGLLFLNAFFFSAHTLTTVGYGNIYPVGAAANMVAIFEAFTGLLLFSIATGLLFGRFSRPSARLGFSQKLIVAPYGDGLSLQFRVVNRRSNNLIELQARVLLMTVDVVDGKLKRNFVQLELERESVLFLALTWTIVHPVSEASPLYKKTPEDLKRLQAELLVLIKGFDDTFGQTVHTRFSYRYDEIVWGARFTPAFEIEEHGDLRLEVNRVGSLEPVALKALELT